MSNIDKQAREQLEAAERSMAEQSAIVAAAEKLVRCKGRYHSELNYRALAKLFGVITPDLPPLEHENVQCADAAEGFRIALASLESMTPEKRAKHDASIEAFKEMLPQPAPVDKEFIPKNLDKALGVVGVALPESKEEFNFQIERWIQRLIDRVIRYADEFKEQPAPVVPDECPAELLAFCEQVIDSRITANAKADELWNDCRDAMLNGDTFRGNSISSTNNFRESRKRQPTLR
ncbi:phage protein [Salmonella bongori]|nr:phage protein [Salmonella bongori]